ncbi:MAG TPA: L-rhamnose isomerase [Anaerolineales bacterium]|nr:L-rhamnose isomerase [Anaerolineales bacterium]
MKYVLGSMEFYLAYALRRKIPLTLDTGHFHPITAAQMDQGP